MALQKPCYLKVPALAVLVISPFALVRQFLPPRKFISWKNTMGKWDYMCRHRGWNYLLKARKPVKDGGGNKMYGSCQALQCHSHMTDWEISIRDLVLPVASDRLGSFVSLSFTGPERGDRTGFLTAPAPQEPASSSYQPARRNTHTTLPASPSSWQHIPQVYNPIPNTITLHLPSTLKTHRKGREHGFLKSPTLYSSSLLVCDPASSAAVWHFI